MASGDLPSAAEGQPSGILSDTGDGERPTERLTAKPPVDNRFASFWKRGHPPRREAPAVVSRTEHRGVKLVRYEDGGRLIAGTGEGGAGINPPTRPDLGMVGLIDLAKGRMGGHPGSAACNPYRRYLPGKRTLVLLVDTSSSVVRQGRANLATTCAAGAALAALRRGYAVEVLNFSSVAVHQPPTRNAMAVYEVLFSVQGQGTVMPGAERLVSASAQPRDFVLVSDTSIGGLEETLPAYQRALCAHPDNRALLFVLGDGTTCTRCRHSESEICGACLESSAAPLRRLQRAGFAVRFVQRPGIKLAPSRRTVARAPAARSGR